jgi:phospholipase C
MVRRLLPSVLLAVACSPKPSGGPDAGPIKYVVVIVKENHTFDNYFTGFPGTDTSLLAPLSDGGMLMRPQAVNGMTARDVSHSHDNALVGWANGQMNGFDKMLEAAPNDGGPPDYLPFTWYAEAQIPAYWTYARQFVLFDRFFSTVFGPSTPGHTALVAAQAPMYSNSFCFGTDCTQSGSGCTAPPSTRVSTYDGAHCRRADPIDVYPCFDLPTIPDVLPKGLTWATYSGGAFSVIKSVGGNPQVAQAHFMKMTDLLTDLESMELPNYLHLQLGGTVKGMDLSEHPPADVCPGENYTVEVVNRLMASPHWKEMAIVITWDDWGGFYDHVPPPVETCEGGGEAFGPGFRLPVLVLSPYARQAVVHDVTEQASVPKLVTELLGTPSLHSIDRRARDEKAGSMMGAFDFTQAPRDPLMLTPRTCP